MSRGNRCSLPGVLTPLPLSLTLLAGCFSPTGSAAPGTDSDASTGQAPTTGAATTRASTGTSDATPSTGTSDATATSASTEPGTSESTTTANTTGSEVCGDGVLQFGEACDDGPGNGDDQPCRSNCVLAVCGDALICDGCEPAETCDDGNPIADDACDLECQRTGCGDGDLDAGEECDDGNELAGDGCSVRCLQEQQFIFLSSVKLDGDFNGLAAADQLCAGLAAPHFNLRRKFVAWMSDPNTAAAARIGVSEFPYRTPKGVQVASSTEGLLDGSLAAPILETEDGTPQPFSLGCDSFSAVWTGTTAMGQAAPDTCSGWSTLAGQGLTGNFAFTDSGWSDACLLTCGGPLRIYCVEKAL